MEQDQQEQGKGLKRDPLEKLVEFLKAKSNSAFNSFLTAWLCFLTVSMGFYAYHIFIYGGFTKGTPLFALNLPAPFNSTAITEPFLNYLYLEICFQFIKGGYFVAVSTLTTFHIITGIKNCKFFDSMAICWLASLCNLLLLIPYTGVWQAWVCESLLIVYFFKKLYKINMVRTFIVLVFCQLLITLFTCIITPIPIDLDNFIIAGFLLLLPLYPHLMLAIY